MAHKLLRERPEPQQPAAAERQVAVGVEVEARAVVLLPFQPDRLLGFPTANRISADTGQNRTPTIWLPEATSSIPRPACP